MKIAFTICSNNYYAQATTLAKSCKKFNGDTHFVIVIVDERSEMISYLVADFEHIFIQELPIDYEDLISRYDIIELNTSIKPSVFLYLINKYPQLSSIHYFDPDIKLFAPLSEVEKYFENKSILLTPHILTPIPFEEDSPVDHLFLNFGIFNLGYLGLKNSSLVIDLLKWWESKTLKLGYNRVCEGLFVDQLWINHVPIFYHDDTAISLNPGMNAAPWNLHERNIILDNSGYMVNNSKLLFYHFSNYDFKTSGLVSKYYRYDFSVASALKDLYLKYHQDLIDNHIEKYSEITCAFYPVVESPKLPQPNKTKNFVKEFIPPILVRILNRIVK